MWESLPSRNYSRGHDPCPCGGQSTFRCRQSLGKDFFFDNDISTRLGARRGLSVCTRKSSGRHLAHGTRTGRMLLLFWGRADGDAGLSAHMNNCTAHERASATRLGTYDADLTDCCFSPPMLNKADSSKHAPPTSLDALHITDVPDNRGFGFALSLLIARPRADLPACTME